MCNICSFCGSDIVGAIPMEVVSTHQAEERRCFFCMDCLEVFHKVVMTDEFKELMKRNIGLERVGDNR